MNNIVDFAREDELQQAIAGSPELLDPCRGADVPSGWLLVERECRLPTGIAAAQAKPVDHLFLDARGVPTLVEAKLHHDARTRREVIGQVMDYLAAAFLEDPAAAIERALSERCRRYDMPVDVAIAEAFAGQVTLADLRSGLRAALAERRFRVVFAVDRVPPELASSIHALDQLMPTVAVHALEVSKHREGASHRYVSAQVTVERWRGTGFAPLATTRHGDRWMPLAVRERSAATVRLPGPRTRLVPLPSTFRLEATDNYSKRSRHQVDPSRPEGHIAVMPNLGLLALTGTPYPLQPDRTVQTEKRWLPWLEIARVTWERLTRLQEVEPVRDTTELLAEAARRAPALKADPNFERWGGLAVLDTLRDLQLYGLCRAFRRGREWRFVPEAAK
jgi:hypothetical protein